MRLFIRYLLLFLLFVIYVNAGGGGRDTTRICINEYKVNDTEYQIAYIINE